jgi:acetyltransferase-like isoleucine patch superfamily enzyme
MLYGNITIGRNIRVYGKVLLAVHRSAKVSIGNNVVFRSATRYNFAGINKPVSIHVGLNAELFIGDNSGFSGTSIFCSTSITIGAYCNFGANTNIWDTDFHPLNHLQRREGHQGVFSKPVCVKDDVFVGAYAIILKGSLINERTVIGAGSVVSGRLEGDSVYAGNPAKFIKKLD